MTETRWSSTTSPVRTWDRKSPMWWHRSPVHRLSVVVLAGVSLFAGYWLAVLVYALLVMSFT